MFVLTRARIAQIVVLVAAICAVLIGFNIVQMTDVQVGLIGAETSTGLILVLAVVVHYKPNTSAEPVYVGASITGFATATTALLVGFDVVDWTPHQVALLLTLVAVILTTVGGWAVRDKVTPTK